MAGYSGNDQVMIRIAVFGLTMSIICTAMITILFSTDATSDYNFDEIQDYRNEVSSFTGQSMLNDTPWVLVGVYEPWYPYMGTEDHVDSDGWLYGKSIDDYPDLGKAADIHLDKDYKSSNPITVNEATYDYTVQGDLKWWAGVPFLNNVLRPIGEFFGRDPYNYETLSASVWNYTGYRYVFDPTLPFLENGDQQTSVRDGSLSIVWYVYNGQEGLSGGLDVYGGNVLLASYSATDIINAYNTSSGYATSYEFDFAGTVLTLSIKFDQEIISDGIPLMQAWSNGNWSMSITSVSVGNFLDVTNSSSYSVTGGSMIKTFIQIYTLSLPDINNDWMNIVLWLLVGLPMTLSLALITLRVMDAVKIL